MNIGFADDIALLSSNANHLQKKTNDLNLNNAMKIGLKIIKKKTKTIQFVQSPPQITLENEILEEVDEFTYLGSKISKSKATEKTLPTDYKRQKVHSTN